jgi:hemerythrin
MEPWNERLEVGHSEMDAEHRGLYGLTERAAGFLAKDDSGGVAGVLSALFTSSERHFATEEGLMQESGYADLSLHHEAHAAFLADFTKLREELGARGLSPLFRLWFGSRFQDWLRMHIRGNDTQFYRQYREWQVERARLAEALLMAQSKAGEVAPTGAPPDAPPPKG